MQSLDWLNIAVALLAVFVATISILLAAVQYTTTQDISNRLLKIELHRHKVELEPELTVYAPISPIMAMAGFVFLTVENNTKGAIIITSIEVNPEYIIELTSIKSGSNKFLQLKFLPEKVMMNGRTNINARINKELFKDLPRITSIKDPTEGATVSMLYKEAVERILSMLKCTLIIKFTDHIGTRYFINFKYDISTSYYTGKAVEE